MSFAGKKHSVESRQKMSQANQGKKLSLETRLKMSEAHKGKKHSPETLQKMSEAQRGEKAHNWKGGRCYTPRGYVLIWNFSHPFAQNRGYVFEHRLVMEEFLGRYLEPHEIIHHKNGIKDDNRLENLELVTQRKHGGELMCPHCGGIVNII